MSRSTGDKWQIGDTGLLVTASMKNRRKVGQPEPVPMEVVIAEMGRKYVYVQLYGRLTGFDMETGVNKGHNAGYSDTLYTRQEWAAYMRLAEVTEGLRQRHAHDVYLRSPARNDVDKLERILAILREGEAAEAVSEETG